MSTVSKHRSLAGSAVSIAAIGVLFTFGCAKGEPVSINAPRTVEPSPASAAPSAASGETHFTAAKKPDSADASWPRFRGPLGTGIAEGANPPLTWSQNQNVEWKTPLPGPGASSPILFGDRIYLTCYTGYFIPDQPGGSLENLKRHLLAISRKDGKILWDRPIPAKLPEESSIRDHGYAANTPAADNDGVVVFFGKSGVIAFNHEGEQLWHADVGSKTHGWGTASSPVFYENLVLINASVESESLVALDRKTGEEVWRAGGVQEAWNTPLVVTSASGRDEAIVPTQGRVLAFDPEKGSSLWSCKTDIGWYMVPSVVESDGIIYCLGGRSGVASLAIRAGGSGDVTESHRLWTSLKGSNVSSPVYHDGHLYWLHEQRGTAYCAKVETGEVVYEERLERAGQMYASALLANGRIYYVTRDGKTFVIAAKPEFEQLAANDLRDGSLFNGSPAADGGKLYIRSDKFLYSLSE